MFLIETALCIPPSAKLHHTTVKTKQHGFRTSKEMCCGKLRLFQSKMHFVRVISFISLILGNGNQFSLLRAVIAFLLLNRELLVMDKLCLIRC